jgi:DNA-binding IclR family transcriptional regulator
VIEIFELLAATPLSAAEVGRKLGTNRSTALRLLSELEETGYIQRDPKTKHYSLGRSKFLRLAAKPVTTADSSQLINETAARIRDETGDSTIFGVPSDQTMTYLGYYATRHVVGLSEGIGAVRPLHCSALGKAYLSALDDVELESQIEGLTYAGGTEKAASSAEELRHLVDRARKDGYALDLEETFSEVRCVAVPVWIDGTVVGAIGITGPATRMTIARMRELGGYLKRQIAELRPAG